MKVIDPGHHYILRTLDQQFVPRDAGLVFVKRCGVKYPGNVDCYAGTTSQEVLRALIDRAEYVNEQNTSWFTRIGKVLMMLTVWLFEARAAKIHGRLPPGVFRSVYGRTCGDCGHVGCRGTCHDA